jgi:hypothetical protein
MATRTVDEADFLKLGLEKHNVRCSAAVAKQEKQVKDFRKFYGIDPKACSTIFTDIQSNRTGPHRIKKANPYKLLMTLEWLRTYKTEFELGTIFFLSESSVSTALWQYTHALQALKEHKIEWLWNNQLQGGTEIIIVSVDGIHCTISEPRTMPSSKWYSHKTHGPALGYEVAIAVHQNKLVHINGPFPAGVPDLALYRQPGGLKSKMPDGKYATADRGYRGEPALRTPNPFDSEKAKHFKKRSQARHETFNARIKSFKILSTRFRHRHTAHGKEGVTCHDNHGAVFEAVCVILQYDMESGHPLFAI